MDQLSTFSSQPRFTTPSSGVPSDNDETSATVVFETSPIDVDPVLFRMILIGCYNQVGEGATLLPDI